MVLTEAGETRPAASGPAGQRPAHALGDLDPDDRELFVDPLNRASAHCAARREASFRERGLGL